MDGQEHFFHEGNINVLVPVIYNVYQLIVGMTKTRQSDSFFRTISLRELQDSVTHASSLQHMNKSFSRLRQVKRRWKFLHRSDTILGSNTSNLTMLNSVYVIAQQWAALFPPRHNRRHGNPGDDCLNLTTRRGKEEKECAQVRQRKIRSILSRHPCITTICMETRSTS